MIDKEKIENLFNELDKYLKELKELSDLNIFFYGQILPLLKFRCSAPNEGVRMR